MTGNRTGQTLERGPIGRLGELQVVQFVSEALRAGERVLLFTGRGQFPIPTPDAAVAACAGPSTRLIHLRPPLPEPAELQDMIGAAVRIAGGRGMTPQAMARLLLFADPRPTVILMIDEAHTLSPRSLRYVALMTELLAQSAPILRIVLAAEPALLDTLAEPEFERLRHRVCRPGFEDIQSFRASSATINANGVLADRQSQAEGGVTPDFAADPIAVFGALQSADQGRSQLAVYAGAGVVAISCLGAAGYLAFHSLTNYSAPATSLNSVPLQILPAPSGQSTSTAAIGPQTTREGTNLFSGDALAEHGRSSLSDTDLVAGPLQAAGHRDQAPVSAALQPAIPSGATSETTAASRSAEEPAANHGDATASSPEVAAPAPSSDDQDPNPAVARAPMSEPPAAAPSPQLGAPDQSEAPHATAISAAPAPAEAFSEANTQEARPSPGAKAPADVAPSAEQPGAAYDGDRAASPPIAAAPTPAELPSERNPQQTGLTSSAEAPASTPADIAPYAQQPGAADHGDQAASPTTAAAPASPEPTSERTADETRSTAPAGATPTPPAPVAPAAEQLGAAGQPADLSSDTASVPPGSAPDRNVVERAPDTSAEAPLSTPAAAPPQEQVGGAANPAAFSADSAAVAPAAAPDRNIEGTGPEKLAEAFPADAAAARPAATLPDLAPVHVVLKVARDNVGPVTRAADVQRALKTAGLDVADPIAVDAERPLPRIGYYFRSDRNAAAGVSHLLEPLLGAVDPVALRKAKSVPEPGTIEIAIP